MIKYCYRPQLRDYQFYCRYAQHNGIEYDVMYTSTKSNVLVFRSKLLKNVHVPEFEINNTTIDRVSMYKYLGHCINDELSDDDDMTRQRNKIYAQGNALIRKFYKCTENVKIALFKTHISLVSLRRDTTLLP